MIKRVTWVVLIMAPLLGAPRTYPDRFAYSVACHQLAGDHAFKMHESTFFSSLHWFNENVVLQPFYAFIHAEAYFNEPFPGENKETSSWRKSVRKTCALLGCCFTSIPALHSLIVGLPLRAILHGNRPFLSYLYGTQKEAPKPSLTKEDPLHIASFNVSFTPSSVNIKMDMRDPVERAVEIAESFLGSKETPDILMIEEGWNEGALKILCERLSSEYPYILHSIAPQILGMSSGCAVFSKFPLVDVKYIRLEKMPPPHNLPPRGITRIQIETKHGPLFIYGGIHTQSMNDLKSVEARRVQIEQIAQVVKEDGCRLAVIMGDMNTTPVDMWGYDNLEQPEGVVWSSLNASFQDLFSKDHDPITGLRLSGEPHFLNEDNERMGLTLSEPVASWYDGPFLREPLQSKVLKEMHQEYLKSGFPEAKMVRVLEKVTWGTVDWFQEQPATRARFDYILLPKDSPLDGKAEIRRIVMRPESQSPASDHLPIHALLWIKTFN